MSWLFKSGLLSLVYCGSFWAVFWSKRIQQFWFVHHRAYSSFGYAWENFSNELWTLFWLSPWTGEQTCLRELTNSEGINKRKLSAYTASSTSLLHILMKTGLGSSVQQGGDETKVNVGSIDKMGIRTFYKKHILLLKVIFMQNTIDTPILKERKRTVFWIFCTLL